MSKRPWTQGEIEAAKSMRGKHTHREIGEALGRSYHSVQQMFKQLAAGANVGGVAGG